MLAGRFAVTGHASTLDAMAQLLAALARAASMA